MQEPRDMPTLLWLEAAIGLGVFAASLTFPVRARIQQFAAHQSSLFGLLGDFHSIVRYGCSSAHSCGETHAPIINDVGEPDPLDHVVCGLKAPPATAPSLSAASIKTSFWGA